MYSEAKQPNQPPANLKTAVEPLLIRMNQQHGSLEAPHEVKYEPITKGLSEAKIWRCQLRGTSYALRCWPSEDMPTKRLAWIHKQLAWAASQGCDFVPLQLEFERGLTWHPIQTLELATHHLGEIAPWMPGDPLSPASDWEQQKAGVEGLAKFHQALAFGQSSQDVAEGFSESVQKRFDLIRGTNLSNHNLTILGLSNEKTQQLKGSLDEVIHEVVPSLKHWSKQRLLLQPVQIDSRPEHFLLSKAASSAYRLTGLIDFGAMRLDTPAVDLARLVGELCLGDQDKMQALLAQYFAVSDTEIDPELISLLDRSGSMGGIMNWVRWLTKLSEGHDNAVARENGVSRVRTLAKRLSIEI